MNSNNITQFKLQDILRQIKQETNQRLCDIYINRLVQISDHILDQNLTASEVNELLYQEAEKIRHQSYENNA
ncbi:DUF2732 family protein [Gilliamella apicola]|uniref:DUF2732 family protein n=1 Tax=Gilliamella apicola TaxID=1196095 RepID=A0A242NDE7_9GAMM|nr:DUF2732 family protein [Gilliamella apicola]OTP81023.1 hypothetical protein B5S40_13600 [Gilliamella apicola]OTP84688.1 hypothetical protein B5S44_09185 [Gilliamella apicola]OTP87643.1 hypothetical protein B5S42_09775 [Gilliamella apicola]OTP97753.1 hypothetical protein B6D08_13600 [Gilliamella apicola]OTQ08141.1 hypothetical protein B6C91_13250 [Gilliamella apicola]